MATKWTGKTTCDLCHRDATKVGRTFVDGALGERPDVWALMCEDCYLVHGVSLGLGMGQQYDSKTRALILRPALSFRHVVLAVGGAR